MNMLFAEMSILSGALALGWLVFLAFMLLWACRHHLHMLQQNTYVNKEYWGWLKKQSIWLRAFVALVLLLRTFFPGFSWMHMLSCLLYFLLCFAWLPLRRKPAKKPLAFTKRMK